MTREVSLEAITALSEKDLAPVVLAFATLKSAAEQANVPHAGTWQLTHLAAAPAAPWRIVDRDAGAHGIDNIALALQAGSAGCLRVELNAYCAAIRGVTALRHRRFSADLMAPSRRP